MSLLLPAFFAAAALIALPILLHLLRRRPRDLKPFPTLRFLGEAALRDTRHQRLMRLLTLLARCALIALVALAFARPFWPKPRANRARAVIVAVDNSFSLQATGRRAALDTWLVGQLANLRAGDQLGVLQLHPRPTWLAPLSDDLAAGRAALRLRTDGYETSAFAPGIALAAAVLAETPAITKQIVLATDEQALGWAGVDLATPLPPGITLSTAPVAPPPARQAAFSNFRATRTPDGKVRLEVSARGFTPAVQRRQITFSTGSRVLGGFTFELSSTTSNPLRAEFELPALTGDLPLRASLDADDLPADDTAYTVLPSATAGRRVLLAAATPGDNELDFLARALTSVRGGDLSTLAIAALPVGATTWPADSVAVLRGPAPFAGEALEKFLQAGGTAWILADGSREQAAWLARHGIKTAPARAAPGESALHLRDFDLDHPLFAPFAGRSLAALLTAEFQTGWSLLGDTLDPLARWPDRTTSIAELRVGAGRVLITGFADRRAAGNWPVQPSFVPFAHHAVVWLGEHRAAPPADARVGERLALPGSGRWSSLDAPRVTTPRLIDGGLTPDAPGIYEFRDTTGPHLYAINVNPAESDLAPWPTPADFAGLVSKQPAPSAKSRAAVTAAVLAAQPDSGLWWWLIAAAVLVLGLELVLANRTVP